MGNNKDGGLQTMLKGWSLVFLFAFLFIGLTSAAVTELKPTKAGDCRQIIQNDDQATSMILTFISLPNGSLENIQTQMDSLGNGSFAYSYCNTNLTGWYTASGNGNYSGSAWSYPFQVTSNGKEEPSGIVILGFSAVFVLILGTLIYMMVYMIAHVVTIDYDALDVGATVGSYFILLGLKVLETHYLGNQFIADWLNLFVQIGIWTHVVIPMFAFALTLTIGTYIRRKNTSGVGN